jgi:hypothetical protein
MNLKSLTYTSLARLDLQESDLEAIQRTARDLNALDGITGLLIFNGTHFLQMVEGSDQAIDDLLVRLRRDPRHSGLEVRDQRAIDQRFFPDWSMELVRVSAQRLMARETVTDRLPGKLPDEVRRRVLAMTEAISGSVAL